MLSPRQFRILEVTNQGLRSSGDQLALADVSPKSSHQLILKSDTSLELREHVEDVEAIAPQTERRLQRDRGVSPPKELLDSWKEIAVFLQRGVRTVQRWEREEGLPVHRHRHSRGGTVFALAPEIQKWLMTRAASEYSESSERPPLAITSIPASLAGDLAARCEAARLRAERARGRFQSIYDRLQFGQAARGPLRRAS